MTHYITGWKCMNVKAHANASRGHGGRRADPNRGRARSGPKKPETPRPPKNDCNNKHKPKMKTNWKGRKFLECRRCKAFLGWADGD